MTHHIVNWMSLSKPHIDYVMLHSNSTACIRNSVVSAIVSSYTGLRNIASSYTKFNTYNVVFWLDTVTQSFYITTRDFCYGKQLHKHPYTNIVHVA